MRAATLSASRQSVYCHGGVLLPREVFLGSGKNRCFSQATLNGLTLRNRLIKAATFEGKSRDGLPGESLVRFHERIGAGGIGMTTLAYCAAEPDGRMHEHMLHMHDGIRPELEALIRRVHATGAKVAGQLSHCGHFSKNRKLLRKRPLGPSVTLNRLGAMHGLPIAGAMTKPQIRERVRAFADAAGYMKSVGFDAIEIHFGHGYAISQFISPRTNKRKDEYGGPLHHRMRFGLEVLAAVRDTVGSDYPLLAKISMSDGAVGGSTHEDAVEISQLLGQAGVDAIVCSGGTSSMSPMYLFRGDSILPGLLEQEPRALTRIAMRASRRWLFKDYPYQELYFLDAAKRIRASVSCNVCYVGGVCTSESIEVLMAEGFDFIQLGRALLFDPDMPINVQECVDESLQESRAYVSGCTHCNRCATLIEAPGGIECVLR